MSNIEVDPDAPVTHRYFAEYLAKAQADRDILLVLIQENTRAARENREAFEAFKKAEEEEREAARADREAIQRKFDMMFERMEAHDKELKEERARNEESKKVIVDRLEAHDKELQDEHIEYEEAKKEREVIVERLDSHDKEINLHREEQKKSEEAKKEREEKRAQMQSEWDIGNYWAYFLAFASIHAGASDCGRRYHVKVE